VKHVIYHVVGMDSVLLDLVLAMMDLNFIYLLGFGFGNKGLLV
jgi:hypothetical protein